MQHIHLETIVWKFLISVKISSLSNFRLSFVELVPQKGSSAGKDFNVQVSSENFYNSFSRGMRDSYV